MTRLNLALNGPERAINFAQGFPDFQTDPRILEAAAAALRDGHNQYATTWGAPQLRSAVARKQPAAGGRDVDPHTPVTLSRAPPHPTITPRPPPHHPLHHLLP